ncbi:MAG: ABC transporter permease [Lachnospiraceae bacterium]|nr:ABC transporter permease [Lachnospiraceae bacterium]
MNKIKAFSSRNRKEILRDPLSYIFCLAFPLVMLIIMTVVDSSIPKQAGMTVFRIDNLSAGIAVFGQTFVMLFTALTVTKDRSGSFLVRMYATPMNSSDFTIGYILPMLIISFAQNIIIYIASFIISLITGIDMNVGGMLLSIIILIPSSVMFICFGLLFGTLFNEKSAPGLCSIIISMSGFLGCIFFDADSTGGAMLKVCKALPFYYCTKAARSSLKLDFANSTFVIPIIIVIVCAAVLGILSSTVFKSKMKADLS